MKLRHSRLLQYEGIIYMILLVASTISCVVALFTGRPRVMVITLAASMVLFVIVQELSMKEFLSIHRELDDEPQTNQQSKET